MVPPGSAAGVWAEPLGNTVFSTGSCTPAERGVRQSGRRVGRGGIGRALTAVGEREALRMATRVAAEGEKQRSCAQVQRPGRRRAGAVEGAEQAAGGRVAQLQPVSRVRQLKESEGELQSGTRRAKRPAAVLVRPVLVREIRGVDDALRCGPVPLTGAHGHCGRNRRSEPRDPKASLHPAGLQTKVPPLSS